MCSICVFFPTYAGQVTSDLYLSKSDLISSGPYNQELGLGEQEGGLVMAAHNLLQKSAVQH